ncbi:MAG: MotA/TolQ/ExbB proton channel family protein [Planctomycetota bacterium]|nr:MAG: MotA/TolQ/ExbB proton channel family protein [Planctomycetota bacterium]
MDESQLDSLFGILTSGGPLMIPIALCSVLALAYMVERSVRLRRGRLARGAFHHELIDALRDRGPDAGLALCVGDDTSQSRILAAGIARADADWLQREKAVEDAGAREVDRLSANLRPLVVIGMIAPLLGLLGTVWGMIEAFNVISSGEGIGSPEALAGGISQALVTTAAGLAVAIPAQAAYYYFRSRIDAFVRRTEDLYLEVSDVLAGRTPPLAVAPAEPAPAGPAS